MPAVLDELVKLLALERIEENLFRGKSQDLGWGTVFGGQVLGQSLSAAVQTVPAERHVHSMHAYFLRPGDVSRPIIYEVDRSRDGGSFTTRRVVAIQKGEPIFHMSASFQAAEEGFDHQAPMPAAPEPEGLQTDRDFLIGHIDRFPDWAKPSVLAPRPFELRHTNPDSDPFKPSPSEARRSIWIRATGPLPDDPALHAYLLAYVSDNGFITTSLRPHGVSWLSGGMQIASLDHNMWFHRPFRVDDWLLYSIESPSAHSARGLVIGHIYTRSGELVATAAQEGLIRRRAKK